MGWWTADSGSYRGKQGDNKNKIKNNKIQEKFKHDKT